MIAPVTFDGRGDLVVVTGATGFVGSAVARRLIAAGMRVRLLVRPQSPRANIRSLEAEVVEGDLLDRLSLDRALSGARALAHVAADYRLWARDPGEIIRNNEEGVRSVLAAARAAGVERVVYTSSVATLAIPPHGAPGDETRPLAPGEAVGAYKESKVRAEARALEAVTRDGLDLVIVNPSTPIGPRDIKPTPTGRVILEAASGRMPAFVDTGLNLVHVDDVAEGHLLALRRGRTGQRYILGGEDVTLGAMLADIAAVVGRPAPRTRLPIGPLFPLAAAAEALAGITGREPFLTRDALKMARRRMYFTSAKAQADLGYAPRPYREGLQDAIDWFRAEGRLR